MSEQETPGVKFPMTIKLAYPVEVGGTKISAITFRMPKGRDWNRWGAEPDGRKRTIGLLVDLSEQPEEVFDEMAIDDHARCIGLAEGFFARYQPEESGLMKLLMTSPSVSDGLLEILKKST